jgi:hypothetical protein
MRFIKDKFETLLVTTILVSTMVVWVMSDYRPDVKEFLIAVFGAWLALLRIVQKPNVQTEAIITDSLETANTETGDIHAVELPKNITKKGENISL